MAVLLVGFMLFFAMVGQSDATYCLCNGQLGDTVLQRDIDYACGAGADCTQILQNGACYNPNTVRDHCNYAVNSYYQRSGQLATSCNFSGTAFVSQTPPTNVVSGCVYPSSASGSPPTIGGTPPNTGFNGNVPPGSTFTPGSGTLGPTGIDNNSALLLTRNDVLTILSFVSAILLSSLMS